MCSFPRAAITNSHKLGHLKNNRNVLSHSIRNSKSRCWQGWFLWEALKESLSHAPGQESFVFLGLETYHSDLCPRLHMVLSLYVSMSNFPLIRTSAPGLLPHNWLPPTKCLMVRHLWLIPFLSDSAGAFNKNLCYPVEKKIFGSSNVLEHVWMWPFWQC